MADATWNFGSRASFYSPSDACFGFEEVEEDDYDELTVEYPCPFCSDDFDLAGLCCHIDDYHSLDDIFGTCPVCASWVEMDMVGHITTQHGSAFESEYKLKPLKDKSQSTLSQLRKELQDAHLQSLFAKSSSEVPFSKMEPDPLLSFIFNVHAAESEDGPHGIRNDARTEDKSLLGKTAERSVQLSPVSDTDQAEELMRSEFVKGLLLSAILDDCL